MKRLHLTLGARLLGTVAVLLGFIAVVGAIGIRGMNSVASEADRMDHQAVRPLAALGDARAALISMRGDTRDHFWPPPARRGLAFRPTLWQTTPSSTAR